MTQAIRKRGNFTFLPHAEETGLYVGSEIRTKQPDFGHVAPEKLVA
jgi:hypothetical protein